MLAFNSYSYALFKYDSRASTYFFRVFLGGFSFSKTFRHSSGSCRGKPTCAGCVCIYQSLEAWCRYLYSVSCTMRHIAYSKSSPKANNEKEIICLKPKETISFLDGRWCLFFVQREIFAKALRLGRLLYTVSLKIQLWPQYLARTQKGLIRNMSPLPTYTQGASTTAEHEGALAHFF